MGFRGWKNNGKNKYGAHKVTMLGIEFDSRVESQRWLYLRDMEKKGQISCLHRQIRFMIIRKITRMVPVQLKTKVRYDERVVELPAYYTCDFAYIENGRYVMEDIKNAYSQEIRDYPLRRKLMMWKIKRHNEKGRGKWIFREAVLVGKTLKIKDFET